MTVFITGASGFIGGAVATRFIRAGHTVRGLIRDATKADSLRAFGIDPVIGTLSDATLLSEEAKRADVVINAASSDDRAAADVLIGALSGSGKTLIHTSGSSIVADEARGEPSDAVFDEDTPRSPKPDKEARVALDRAILDAPGVRSIVLCNSLIYGDALGPDARSVQLPRLVDLAKSTGAARYIGRGLNRWSTVHIADVADLYFLAYERAPDGFFAFVENGESAFADMVQAIADALGLGQATGMTSEAAESAWGREVAIFALGSNSRVRAKRARALGWTPAQGSAEAWVRQAVR
ncbi:NAD-dependent epimerase/dehydratase family protein [Asticcacaulis sp. DXS10W]|uniref:NAD-dependent epimerase/dehydratase family protein n=1 Tax=Asticcacaulis currens TaxID=2984210 RepID=A0ABT5IDI9_9CAUL|nr:NAD-dependent epimerase/dehydratase family protein [Asticcacaulis currens]MDC7694214.1 NAD-dependent epimerase/dehydratase family protein [Asticcacaulis currens]